MIIIIMIVLLRFSVIDYRDESNLMVYKYWRVVEN